MMVEFNSTGNATFEDPRLPLYATQKKGAWKGSYGGVANSDYKQYDNGAAVPNFTIMTGTGSAVFGIFADDAAAEAACQALREEYKFVCTAKPVGRLLP